jgi:oligoribonuclease NrnB/cAMP/cGMP phosphodiesterase (DHH superfamily)
MNFFDILKALLFDKKKEERPDADTLQSFTPYMVNRWLSFYDKTKAVFVNETLNKFSSIFDNKEDQYELYSNLIPRSKFKRISYIKKKKEITEEDENISVISKNNMLSKREVQMYVDLYNSLAK